MKKLILMLSVCFMAIIVSCKDAEKKVDADVDTEMTEEHIADDADIAMNAEYQCPMDCEEGKTYDEEGKCPVCKMNLKKVEKEHDDNDDEDHD